MTVAAVEAAKARARNGDAAFAEPEVSDWEAARMLDPSAMPRPVSWR